MAKNQKKTASQKSDIVINQITVAQLERGNQTIQTWINNVRSAERVLTPNWKYLLNTYLDIDIDLHLDSCTDKRIRALKNVPFEWPGLEDGQIKDNLQSPWFYEFLTNIGKGIFWGYGVTEFEIDGLIKKAIEIPRQNIMPQKKVIVRRAWGDVANGFHYTEAPFNNYMQEIGDPLWLGKYMKIAPLVLLKRGNLSDFSRFNEMFGFPMRIYEYDPHDPTARNECEKQAKAQGAAAYVIVPKGTTLTLAEGDKAGSKETFSELHRILNDEITIGVLGQTLTTTNDGKGSNALGKVHMTVESEIAMEDRTMVELLINYSFKNNILLPHGYPVKDIKGAFKLTEEVSMEKKINMWLSAIDRGVKIAEEDFYEEFGIPFPDGRPVIVPVNNMYPEADPDKDPDDPNNPGSASKKPGGAPAKKPQATSKLVADMYIGVCRHRHKEHSLSLTYASDLNDIIEDVIKKLHNGTLKAGDVSEDLWKLISEQLGEAVQAGFTGLKGGLAHDAMIKALIKDVQVFSGFKNYHMLREATQLLIDPQTNNIRSFANFRDEILKLNDQYNVDFLRAEYNHAVGSARMAGKWADFQENASIYPLLQYITAGDSRVRASHRKLNNIILPVDHPFWDTWMPPNDWNCRCNVKQIMSGEQTIIKNDELPVIKDEFKFNPGKQRVIFPKNHPYYEVAAEDEGIADNNFSLPINP